jgi:hypothetical protein
MKIFVDLENELDTSYKTDYIKWFQYLLPYMSIHNITDGVTADKSEVIILTVGKYRTVYHNNPKFSMKKYILIHQDDSSSIRCRLLQQYNNIIFIFTPHSLNPYSLNNCRLLHGRRHLLKLNEIYKRIPFDNKEGFDQNDYGSYTDKIKCIIPHWFRYPKLFNIQTKPLDKRTNDVFFSGTIKYHNKDPHLNIKRNEFREKIGSLVTQHRLDCITAVNNLSCKSFASTNKLYYKDYINYANNSKLFVSPYGWGEFSHKDFEITLLGCILIKPSSNSIISYPNIYEDGVTCISCKLDYSDLEEKVNYLLNNPTIMLKISNNVNNLIKKFSDKALCAEDLFNLLKPHMN